MATTVVAAGCYWLMLPTFAAQNFASAVASKNYTLADSYFCDTDDQFLAAWNEKHWRFLATATLEPLSLRDIVSGKRLIDLRVAFGDAGPMRFASWTVVASRSDMLKPEPTWSGGGMGGGGIL